MRFLYSLNKLLFPVIRFVVNSTLLVLDRLYPIKSIRYRRFYLLESIARIPYFSYLSVLHLYQSLGKHPAISLMSLHYKESINEAYHLEIAEELGGSKHFFDRWFAKILSVFYYWINVVLYLLFPSAGYYLMEVVEKEAFHTYSVFLETYEKELKSQPATKTALKYYFDPNARMLSGYGESEKEVLENLNLEKQSGKVISLFDVFSAIKRDEEIHTLDMNRCSSSTSLYGDRIDV